MLSLSISFLLEQQNKKTNRYIPIANSSHKAYSLFHSETGTTDNLHG